MLPELNYFRDTMRLHQIRLTDRVILYDFKGSMLASRAYFMFCAFGHHNTSVLNGGFQKWAAEGGEVTKMPYAESDFDYKLDESLVRNFE
mmetsp:Transcript_45968/g.33722  ORF Transcript_45968/g.33722 Transcript_45968/m.33722 type:complete len:90 (-) Transcript_45968:350-619(-)